jgi:hypothetical protein
VRFGIRQEEEGIEERLMNQAGKFRLLYAKICAKFTKRLSQKKPIEWEGKNLLELIYKHQVEGMAAILILGEY